MNLRRIDNNGPYKQGSIYRINTDIFKNTLSVCMGDMCICIHKYDDDADLMLFENNEYDGFSREDIDKYLIYEGWRKVNYNFTNVIKLSHNIRERSFDQHIDYIRKLNVSS